jgi:hypothetical protein
MNGTDAVKTGGITSGQNPNAFPFQQIIPVSAAACSYAGTDHTMLHG